MKKENRTERVGVILTPETFKNLKLIVAMKNDTMNNFIHTLIDESVEKEKKNMEKYIEFKKNM